jgi:hypothetical protein
VCIHISKRAGGGIELTRRPLFKDKVIPRTGHEGPEGEKMYGCTLSSTSALIGVGV